MPPSLRLAQLEALEYPAGKAVDLGELRNFHAMVVWLEDTKIRARPMEQRQKLREQPESTGWEQELASYLEELGSPITPPSGRQGRLRVADFLLSQAVSLEYQDNKGACQEASQRIAKRATGGAAARTSLFPLPYKDALSDEAAKEAACLARRAGREGASESKSEAAATLAKAVRQHLSPEVLEAGKGEWAQRGAEALEGFPLGFEMPGASERLSRAAKILRLLYINDLRELQTAVDRLLVRAQEISADPRTEAALGKVGR